MAIKLGATGITFHDNSVQTTAGGPVTTQYAIGSYVLGRPQNTTNYNNDTIAGSSLYATFNSVAGDPESGLGAAWAGYLARQNNSGNYNGTHIASSLVNTGSWRCVSLAGGPGSPSGNGATPGLWVRYA